MELHTPDSDKFAESMEDLYSDDFQELIVEPQDGYQSLWQGKIYKARQEVVEAFKKGL